MAERPFVDHYETLQLSPSADGETVERVYRLLAKRYHPDSPSSGNAERFGEVREAYETLSDPVRRAAYDARYDQEKSEQWQIYGQDTADDDRRSDQRLFHALLSLLYIARRRRPDEAGLAPSHLERMLGTPREHLDFPLWYLKKRGFIEILETGLLAITVDGIDKLGSGELSLPANRLLSDSSMGDSAAGGQRREPVALPGRGPERDADEELPPDSEPLRATS